MSRSFKPEQHVAIMTTSGSVYHPIWQDEASRLRGTLVHAKNEKLVREGGNYLVLPHTIQRCLTQTEYEVWAMLKRNGVKMPPAKR